MQDLLINILVLVFYTQKHINSIALILWGGGVGGAFTPPCHRVHSVMPSLLSWISEQVSLLLPHITLEVVVVVVVIFNFWWSYNDVLQIYCKYTLHHITTGMKQQLFLIHILKL